MVLLRTEPHIRAPVARRFRITILWTVRNESFWDFGGAKWFRRAFTLFRVKSST